MSTQRNYYEILRAERTATFDELKSNYKQLILQCHPDKLQRNDDDPIAEILLSGNNTFVCINEAWNTLKDPVKRKHYDAELLQMKFQTHNNVFERLALHDMTRHVDGVEQERAQDHEDRDNGDSSPNCYYTYNCRCGGQYIVDESEYHDCAAFAVAANKDNSDSVDIDDEDDDDEVIVECSECSLVIILHRDKRNNVNAKQQQ